MSSKYETLGGQVTRGETYAKTLDLLDQLLDQTAVMAHLHQTETTPKDTALAQGWLGMHHAFQIIRRKMTELAKGSIQ